MFALLCVFALASGDPRLAVDPRHLTLPATRTRHTLAASDAKAAAIKADGGDARTPALTTASTTTTTTTTVPPCTCSTVYRPVVCSSNTKK
jgi:hypothetical protein